MRSILVAVMLVVMSVPAYAEEVVDPVAAPEAPVVLMAPAVPPSAVAVPEAAAVAVVETKDAGGPSVLEMILSAVAVAVGTVLTSLLAKWSAKMKAEANKDLKGQAIEALARISSNLANKELAALKEAASDGKVSKDELKALGDKAIEDVKSEFKSQGVDVAKRLGSTFLNSALRRVVDKIGAK